MTQVSPKLRVSSQVLNTHSAVKHTAAKNKTEGASAAKNASAPHTRGGRKRKRGGAQPVPTLAVSSGPPTSSPNAGGNIVQSHKTNATLVAAAANDSKVPKPKCAANTQSGGGSRLGKFIERLHNMEGGKRKRRTRKKKRHRRTSQRRTRHKRRKRRQRRRGLRRHRHTRRRRTQRRRRLRRYGQRLRKTRRR